MRGVNNEQEANNEKNKHLVFERVSVFNPGLGMTQLMAAEDWPAEPPAEAPAHWGPVSLNLEEIEYPWPVQYPELRRYGQKMLMAYMDIPPTGPANGQVVFWQHGHNFYSEPYQDSFRKLAAAGFESSRLTVSATVNPLSRLFPITSILSRPT